MTYTSEFDTVDVRIDFSSTASSLQRLRGEWSLDSSLTDIHLHVLEFDDSVDESDNDTPSQTVISSASRTKAMALGTTAVVLSSVRVSDVSSIASLLTAGTVTALWSAHGA